MVCENCAKIFIEVKKLNVQLDGEGIIRATIALNGSNLRGKGVKVACDNVRQYVTSCDNVWQYVTSCDNLCRYCHVDLLGHLPINDGPATNPLFVACSNFASLGGREEMLSIVAFM